MLREVVAAVFGSGDDIFQNELLENLGVMLPEAHS